MGQPPPQPSPFLEEGAKVRKRSVKPTVTEEHGWVDKLSDEQVCALYFGWYVWAYDKQKPPEGDWVTWLMMGGRGSGKTRAGAEWVRGLVERQEGPIAIVGETITEAISVMVRGVSGIMEVTPPWDKPKLRDNVLYWPNGTEGIILGATDPERFRGPQFAAAWCDETAKWRHAQESWDMLQFGLRLGDHPRQLVTTKPRSTKFIRQLAADPLTRTVRISTKENHKHLANSFLQAVVARYRDSVLGRQELEGELIDDMPGALWTRDMFVRSSAEPDGRVVVAVDPPVTANAGSDACGIIVAGRSGEGAIVMADFSLKQASPIGWASRAVWAATQFNADAIVAEVNQGGDLVAQVIGQVDPSRRVKAVHATRGKWVRAEPVATLYSRGLVTHRAGLTELEDEMCSFGADGLAKGHSPDRVDALVWALTELMLGAEEAEPRVRGM